MRMKLGGRQRHGSCNNSFVVQHPTSVQLQLPLSDFELAWVAGSPNYDANAVMRNPHLGCEGASLSARGYHSGSEKEGKKTGKATVAVLEKRIDALLASLTEKREIREQQQL